MLLVVFLAFKYGQPFISKHLIFKPERDQLFEKLAQKYNLQLILDKDKMVFTMQSALKGENFARKIQGTVKGFEVVVADFSQKLVSFDTKRNVQYFVSPLITKFFINGKEQFPPIPFFAPLANEEEISAFLDSIK